MPRIGPSTGPSVSAGRGGGLGTRIPYSEEKLYQELCFRRGINLDGTMLDGRGYLGNRLGSTRKAGQAVLFDGATQWIDTGEAWLPETGDFTICFWVSLVSKLTDDVACFGQWTSNNESGFRIEFDSSGGNDRWEVKFDNDAGSVYPEVHLNGTYIADTTWRHLIVSREGTAVSFRENNVVSASGTLSDAAHPVNQGVNTAVGAKGVSLAPCNCKVADLRILHRVLTTAERTAVYNQGIYKNRLVAGQPDGADYYRWLPLDDGSQTTARCCVTGNSYTITGGDSGSPYPGADVPWSRQNIIGCGET